jgi:S1-C subfamily serine protease
MAIASDLSAELAGVVEKSSPAVVRVQGRRRAPSSGILWSADTVVTAHHTVERDEDVEVSLAGGGAVAARVAGRDPATDLAALRLGSPAAGMAASWIERDARLPAAGNLVLGVSRPGRSIRATLGIISRVAESWRTPLGGRLDAFLETDLAMHTGFSGSALVDLSGRVIGVNTSGILRGVSLAVPAATVRRIVEALLARGRVRKGYLGVGTYPVRLPSALSDRAGQSHGLLLFSVQPDSPAARGGLMLGDVILALAGERVENAGDLLPLLEEERVGSEAPVRVLRGGEPRELRVTIGDRAAGTEETSPGG